MPAVRPKTPGHWPFAAATVNPTLFIMTEITRSWAVTRIMKKADIGAVFLPEKKKNLIYFDKNTLVLSA